MKAAKFNKGKVNEGGRLVKGKDLPNVENFNKYDNAMT